MNRTASINCSPGAAAPASPALTLGQRVIVFAPDTWLHRREGYVVSLPRPSGLLHDPMVSVRIDGDTPLGPDPVRALDPRRVAPVGACETCYVGCDCDGSPERPGCGHFGCWGPATYTERLMRCPDADVYRAQLDAYAVARGWAVTR